MISIVFFDDFRARAHRFDTSYTRSGKADEVLCWRTEEDWMLQLDVLGRNS